MSFILSFRRSPPPKIVPSGNTPLGIPKLSANPPNAGAHLDTSRPADPFVPSAADLKADPWQWHEFLNQSPAAHLSAAKAAPASSTIPPTPQPEAPAAKENTVPNKATVIINGIETAAEDFLDLFVHPAATTAAPSLAPQASASLGVLLQQVEVVVADITSDVSNPLQLLNVPFTLKQLQDLKAVWPTLKAEVAKIGIKL